VLECVVNLSEGRRDRLIDAIAATAGTDLLDLHRDRDHHRSVLTLIGSVAPRAVAATVVAEIDLGDHQGAHPRFGALDVVPFVPLGSTSLDEAIAARDAFGAWAADQLGLPCFRYGPERTLPEVRRQAFTTLSPDFGPGRPHRTAGAVAIGARRVLVAYNLWLARADLALARSLARQVRSPQVRALGLAVGDQVQVSMNLLEPDQVGPDQVYDQVSAVADVARGELVGLIPQSVLAGIDAERWAQLGLSADTTIEARLAARTADQRR
jgi:glutamate formiminotransferase / 5-formyltetrahydrofolate cyclo-ligase